MTNKGLISKIYKQHIQLNIKKPNNLIKNGQNIWIDIFPRKTYRWPTWKDAQHHWLLEKCKSKLQWGITSHLLGWLLYKRQEINAGENVKKREPLCTTGGNVSWCSHYGKWYGGSSKNKKIELPTIPHLDVYLKGMKSGFWRGIYLPPCSLQHYSQ